MAAKSFIDIFRRPVHQPKREQRRAPTHDQDFLHSIPLLKALCGQM
jgi:hypothetical protein